MTTIDPRIIQFFEAAGRCAGDQRVVIDTPDRRFDSFSGRLRVRLMWRDSDDENPGEYEEAARALVTPAELAGLVNV